MKKALVARLERLESRPETKALPAFRYGRLRPLPDDYVGERHIVTLKSEPTRSPHIEWCEFEERQGKGPALDASGGMTVYWPHEDTTAEEA